MTLDPQGAEGPTDEEMRETSLHCSDRSLINRTTCFEASVSAC